MMWVSGFLCGLALMSGEPILFLCSVLALLVYFLTYPTK